MRVGVPKEIKNHEYRVGLTPASVGELIAAGHEVFVETKAGNGIDFADSAYEKVGAKILPTAADVFAQSDMIVKVKEPQPSEIAMLEPRHLLFTYLHLAADKPQAEGLMKSGATCIAYETVTSRSGALPLLKPMSEVAGRMSIQVGAHYLEKEQGGRGVLLGGVPGIAPAKVAILGGGVAGINAAQMATGQRADVTIYDINNDRLADLEAVALRLQMENDTLGAMVKEIKPNGRLKLTKLGGFAWNTVEGEGCTVLTAAGRPVRGSSRPL